MKWDLLTNFIIALFAIINPLGKIPVWLEASGDQKNDVQKRLAGLIILTSGTILLLFLIFGKDVLYFFGIDIASFKIGGGIVILIFGLNMLNGKAVNIEREDLGEDADVMVKVKSRFRQIVIPIAVPLIAGPGSLTTVIIYGSRANTMIDLMAMIVIVILSLLIVYLSLISGTKIKKFTGELPLMIITRLFGLILIAIAVQLIAEGLGTIFPSWLDSQSGIESQIKDDINSNNN